MNVKISSLFHNKSHSTLSNNGMFSHEHMRQADEYMVKLMIIRKKVVCCWEAPPLAPPPPLVVSSEVSVPIELLSLVSWPHPHSPLAELNTQSPLNFPKNIIIFYAHGLIIIESLSLTYSSLFTENLGSTHCFL